MAKAAKKAKTAKSAAPRPRQWIRLTFMVQDTQGNHATMIRVTDAAREYVNSFSGKAICKLERVFVCQLSESVQPPLPDEPIS